MLTVFEEVSRAFQILSDPDKKSKYDKFGGDPESRFSGASASGASPFSGFASQRGARAGGPMFEEEISPEELFRQFFGGGGMGGGPFGGPFGGFGMYSQLGHFCSTANMRSNRRRKRFRLQHGRRARRQSTSNGRRHASKTATQPRQSSRSLPTRSTPVAATFTTPLHRPTALLPLLRLRTNIPFSPL